ncbi:MAG: LysR family transcriptional regulator [Myxococcota bacterium]
MQRKPLPPSALNWDDVRLFLALARARTLGEAARTLSVDTSTISRRLTALEQAIGATLFDRGRSGVSTTEAAEDLLPVAEQIERAMAQFTGTAERFERQVQGLVRITCPPDAAEVLLGPLIPALLAQYPDLRIEIDDSDALVDIARRAADIALRVVRPDRGDLVVKKLMPVRWMMAMAPKLAQKFSPLQRWNDVPWIAPTERFAHTPMARWIDKHVDAAPVLHTDSSRLQLTFAELGLGAALVPSGSIEHFGLTTPKLHPRLKAAAKLWPAMELFIVTHRALREVPRVRAVWRFLIEATADRQ